MTASSKDLGKLHQLLTQVLTAEVEECLEEQEVLVGMDPETDEPEYAMQRKPIAPALAGQVIAFLKNNNITAGTEDDAIKALQEKLNQSRQAGRRPAKPSAEEIAWQAENQPTRH